MKTILRHQLAVGRRTRSQGGYILATVLGLMVLSTLLLAALLALTQSTVRIEQTGKVRERQARAAEGAVEVALNQIRNSPNIASADPFPRKQSGDPGYLAGQPYYLQPPAVPGDAAYVAASDPGVNRAAAGGVCDPVQKLITVDNYPVRIFCWPQGLSQYDSNGNTVPGIPQDDGGIAVRLVGSADASGNVYKGDTSNPGFTDLAANWRTTFPFSSAVQSGFNVGEVNSTKGQLLYTGANPLQIVGAVQVKNQIAAAASAGTGPAMEVQGAVRQGGKGMFSAGTGDYDCGIARSDDPNNSPRADVRIDSLFVPLDKGLQCNQPDMKTMSDIGTVAPNGDWNNDRVQRSRYETDWQSNDGLPGPGRSDNPNVPTDCGQIIDPSTGFPASVITIKAGAYDARATKTLNMLFSACNDRTWYFPGGDYWFDVNDPSVAASDPSKNALVFNNRTSNWVFGPMPSEPNRPAISAFPEACDHGNATPADGSRGTSITLSSRTGIFHRAGRVAICGPIGVVGGQSTAIWQRPANSLGARLLPTGLTAGSFTDGTSPLTAATIQADDGAQIRALQYVPPTWWDSGTATFSKWFTATGFGQGGPNGAYQGPSPVSSVYVDITGSGNQLSNPNQDLTSTRLDVTLSDNTTCYMIYGPSKSDARRLPGNNQVTSYNLLDPAASGNCNTVLGSSMTRDKFYGATVKATFTMNPPTMANTQFSWWDWWPWWRDHVVKPACDLVNAGIDWFNFSVVNIFDWYLGPVKCDNRPMSVTYSVNSIALRIGWSPVVDRDGAGGYLPPVNASDGPPANPGCPNCIPVQNAANGARLNANGTANTGPSYPDASVTMPAGFGYASSFSNLRYTLTDPTLLDGFLSLQDIAFNFKISRSGFGGINGADDVVDNSVRFTLKTPDGIWCRNTVNIPRLNGSDQSTTGANDIGFKLLNPSDGVVRFQTMGDGSREVIQGCVRPADPVAGPMRVAPGDTNVVRDVEVGQILGRYDHQVGGNFIPARLDVEVVMKNSGAARSVGIDYVSLSAYGGKRDAADNIKGYPRPEAPFTVTWSPMTPNNNGDGATGDATFNVWGSVSVPNNDVRVVWNWDTARYGGPLGFPIFNAGKQPYDRCNPYAYEQCQPALVASALGSWTTTSTNGTSVNSPWAALTPDLLPDPLASTGSTRKPFRKVLITACVVDPDGAGVNGDLLPRVQAEATIADRKLGSDGKWRAVVPGASLWITQWNALRDPAFQPTVDATTNVCGARF